MFNFSIQNFGINLALSEIKPQKYKAMKKLSLLFACIGIFSNALFAQEPVKVKSAQEPVKVAPVSKAEKAPVAATRVEPAPKTTSATTTAPTPTPMEGTAKTGMVKVKPIRATATAVPIEKEKAKQK